MQRNTTDGSSDGFMVLTEVSGDAFFFFFPGAAGDQTYKLGNKGVNQGEAPRFLNIHSPS